MDKVTLLLWQSRDDPRVVGFMTRFLTRYSGERDIFDGIEFYLPQLAHMVIHLEANWDDAILERFALIISQHSLHFALPLNWILIDAIEEDYPPKTKVGQPNLSCNVPYYTCCVKLVIRKMLCLWLPPSYGTTGFVQTGENHKERKRVDGICRSSF